MHELAIVQNLLEQLALEAEKHGLKRITRIVLKIGKFTGIVPSCLSFGFEILTRDNTLFEGAELAIEEVPLTCRCTDCRHTFDSDDYVFRCPQCDGKNTEIVSGRELLIQEMEGE